MTEKIPPAPGNHRVCFKRRMFISERKGGRFSQKLLKDPDVAAEPHTLKDPRDRNPEHCSVLQVGTAYPHFHSNGSVMKREHSPYPSRVCSEPCADPEVAE
jgi:hypothetical protein